MKTVIIYAHPWDGSFNHVVLEETIAALKLKGTDVDVIDLNKDGFNPVLTQDDLKLFGKGEYHDSLALNYLTRLKDADAVIFIYPIWWFGMPAILKGFIDKVMLKGHAYTEVDHALTGLLNIKKSAIFTTANISKEVFNALGDPVEKATILGIFKTIGIENTNWLHCKTVHEASSRTVFLEEIKDYLKEL